MPYVTLPRPILIDANGIPRVAAKMHVYDAGTTTPHVAYTGPDLTIQHPDPILSVANGYFPSVWVDPAGGNYKLAFEDANGVPLPIGDDNIPPIENFTSNQLAAALDSLALTQNELAVGVTPVNYAYEPGNILRYGNNTIPGETDMYEAAMAAISTGYLYFPPGDYLIGTKIELDGSDVVIRGYPGGTHAAQLSRIVDDTTGGLFEDLSGAFGALYIGHLAIIGGSRDGTPAIVLSRPQSLVEYVHIEGEHGYRNPGFKMTSVSQGAWDTTFQRCKWVGEEAVQTNFRGYYIDIDGGNIELNHCTATRGSVGCEIIKGEAIVLRSCNFNLQYGAHSSETTANGQCALRLSGAGIKKSVKVDSCYLEGSSTSLWIEAVECLNVDTTFMDDLGNENLIGVKLVSSASTNVTIQNCHIWARGAGAKAVENAGTNVVIDNCRIQADGSIASLPLDNTGTNLIARNNRLIANVAGVALKTTTSFVDQGNVLVAGGLTDTSGLRHNLFPVIASFTPILAGSTTPGAHTYSKQYGTCYTIGRMVYIEFGLVLTAKGGTMAGNVRIEGLPFQVRNTTSAAAGIALSVYSNIDLSSTTKQLTAILTPGTTTLTLQECFDNAAGTALAAAAITNTTEIYGSGWYLT